LSGKYFTWLFTDPGFIAVEYIYIDYFLKRFNNIILESNDVLTDYHIMKNAKILICSCSTLSWAASLFSDTVEELYFPDYYHTGRIHVTFKQPIENTVLYKFKNCSKTELESIL